MQLKTVLRTVNTLLQNNSDTAHLDTSHTKQVLHQLSKCLNTGAATQETAQSCQNSDTSPPSPPTTRKKTYAEATSTMKRPTGPPRTHNKSGTKPTPSRRSDFGRLIVDFGRDETVHQIPPDNISKIRSSLNLLYPLITEFKDNKLIK